MKVSIIIVTFNSANVIKECLEALERQTFKDCETIVVDNQSTDNTIDIVKKFAGVKLVGLNENRGFTGGNIEGLKYCHGEYIVLLNPDTEAVSEWLQKFVEAMDFHPEAGICASKLVVHGTDLIDSAGDGCTTTGRGFKRGEGESAERYNEEEYVFGACGAAMLIRKELIQDIGFLDDDFFLIFEDVDFCLRSQLAGWKCLFVPEALVYHKVRTSIGHMSDLAVYYSIRNARIVLHKNFPLILKIKFFHHHLIQEVATFIYFVIKHHKPKIYLRANRDFLKKVPSLNKKRKAIKKTISYRELNQELSSIIKTSFIKTKLGKLING
ncbi:MAG: glycosyltransferase family 2 protein [Chitinophagales bacterium]